MNRDSLSRRDIVRSSGALMAAGTLGTLSGCLGFFDSDDEPELGQFAHVPFGTSFALHADVEAILNDGSLREGFDETLPADSLPYRGTASVSGILDAVEEDTGLDVRAVSETLSFGGLSLDDAATILWADWDATDVRDAISTQTDIEAQTHEERTVYATANAWTCELDEGVFVTGAPSTTRATIDLWAGGERYASDRLADAYLSSAPGMVRYGFDIPPDVGEQIPGGTVNEPLIEDINYGFGGLYADGTDRIGEVQFQTANSSAAETLENALFTVVTLLGQDGGELELPASIEAVLGAGIDDVEVGRDEDVVTVAYRNEAVDLGPLLVELVGELRSLFDFGDL